MIHQVLLLVETTLLLSVAALYIMHCPFNKVEESFNTQAIHDFVNIYPNNLPTTTHSNSSHLDPQEVAIRSKLPWDHTQFPGVVPRTFIGALIIGLPMRLAKHLMSNGFLSEEVNDGEEADLTFQFVLQIGSRFALSSLVILSLSAVTRSIQKRYGLPHRLCFLLATVTEFHYLFYCSRFIPNTFAAIAANLTFASWINRQYSKSVIYIAFCVVIFRFDTILFFGWLLFDGVFIKKYLSLGRVLRVGIPAGLVALVVSFLVDSFFWARPVLPEFESLYFNIWLNKSHEWGTEPYFWYIYNCIPRILMAGAPLILLADHKITRDYLIPTLAFIFTYSLLPHKELRFILFVTPFLNICVASGLLNVHYYLNKLFLYLHSLAVNKKTDKKKDKKDEKKISDDNARSYIGTSLFLVVIAGLFVFNILGCFILSSISSHNYPGGQAAISLGMTKELLDNAQKSVDKTANLQDPRSDVGIYVNNLAAQTGMSRFLQVNGAYYAKSPKLDDTTFTKTYNYIYLIFEPKEVTDFLKSYCPPEDNPEHLLTRGADEWKRSKSEIKCIVPNQPRMFCAIIDSIKSFSSVNIGGLIRRLRQTIYGEPIAKDEGNFVKTRMALHVLRCSTRSKFNPLAT